MNKKIVLFASIVLFLVGCSYSKEHPPTDHNMVCEEIEQKLTFADSDANTEMGYNSPTKQAELYRQFSAHNCDVKQ
jgi:hypothetical protein